MAATVCFRQLTLVNFWCAVLAVLGKFATCTPTPRQHSDYSERWEPVPNQRIPYGFELETLDGKYILDPDGGAGAPLLFYGYLPEDARLRYMWNPKNSASISAFLDDLPADMHVLFVSYSNESLADVSMMRNSLLAALQRRPRSQDDIKARLSRFHFSKAPMSGVSDQKANFLPNLMGHWTSSRAVVEIHASGPEEKLIERLDVSYEWLPWPPPAANLPVVPFGDGCRDLVPFDVHQGIALVVRGKDSLCSYAHIISRAQAANASALLVSALPGQDMVEMSCEGDECDLPLRIFATMIPHAAAAALEAAAGRQAEAGLSVVARFRQDSGPGYFAAVDELFRLQEVGWTKFPTLQHLSWAGQWLSYAQSLRAKLQAEALVIPVFDQELMQGEHGLSREVAMPPEAQMDEYGKVHLDFELSCPGAKDADCPIWDHVIQLFVCCDDDPDCEQCDVTPWLHLHHPEDAAEAEWQQAVRDGEGAPKQRCGRELGRWVTPFRRRIGRWLTDVTPLRGLLRGKSCHFTAQTAPWALPWKPSLRLRFSEPRPAANAVILPLGTEKLFSGGTFDKHYNDEQGKAVLRTPRGTSRVLLYAVITGHGSDEFNCAEFCPTSHHFLVNGKEVLVNFTEAGTQWGCTKHVLEGVEPNEHGTWQYGRGGWCDGADVPPWVFDVTAFTAPAGEENTLAYKGLFQGRDPDPKSTPGYIMMESSLVFLGDSNQVVELY